MWIYYTEKLSEGERMAAVALKCPFCGSEDVHDYGASNGKKWYACNNPACSHKTFYAECSYNGSKPDVKKAIIKWAADGAGIRCKRRYGHKRIKRKTNRLCEQRVPGIP
jgi:transposase-like protein